MQPKFLTAMDECEDDEFARIHCADDDTIAAAAASSSSAAAEEVDDDESLALINNFVLCTLSDLFVVGDKGRPPS